MFACLGIVQAEFKPVESCEKSLQQKAKDLEQSEEWYRQLVEQITAVTYIDHVDYSSSTIFISPQITKVCG